MHFIRDCLQSVVFHFFFLQSFKVLSWRIGMYSVKAFLSIQYFSGTFFPVYKIISSHELMNVTVLYDLPYQAPIGLMIMTF